MAAKKKKTKPKRRATKKSTPPVVTHDELESLAGLLTSAQLSAELKVTPGRISQMRADGMPHRTKVGRIFYYDLEETRRWYQETYGQDPEAKFDLTQEKARLAKEQADKCEMDNLVRRGELLDAPTTEALLGDIFGDFKTRMLTLPPRCISRMKNAADLVAAQHYLDQEIRKLLIETAEALCEHFELSPLADSLPVPAEAQATAATDRQ